MTRNRWIGLGIFVLGILCMVIGRAIGPLQYGEMVSSNAHNFGKALGLVVAYIGGLACIMLGTRRLITSV